jgi:hypothetical protein
MKSLLFSFYIIFILMCCNPFKKEDPGKEYTPVDVFYTDRGGYGTYPRIPLIKPYEAIKISDNEWRVELHTTDLLELSIHNVHNVNVIDSLIILYARGEISIKDIKYDEAWFVIDPSKNSEKGFDKKDKFLSYLAERNIKDPKLYNADKVYDKFYTSKKLNWEADFK